jgi:hypothetical protein
VQLNREERASSPAIALTLLAAAGACAAVGAASLTDAAAGTQDILNVISARQANALTCAGPFNVSGYGLEFVVICTAACLALLAATGWALLRVAAWGELTAFLATVPAALLWLDSYEVSTSPIGDCDGIGPSGAASAAINHAGWCFFIAIVLTCASWAWLRSRTSQPNYLVWQ